jgi:hypothetical protein
MTSINQRLEEIEYRSLLALYSPYWRENCDIIGDYCASAEDIPKLLALARYLIPIAEDHLSLEEARKLRQKIEEILS